MLAAIPPVVRLGRDMALCAGAAPLLLQPNLQPAGSTYRWADGTTAPTYAASRPGLYWLEVRNAASGVARDTLLVRVGSIPLVVWSLSFSMLSSPTLSRPMATPKTSFLC